MIAEMELRQFPLNLQSKVGQPHPLLLKLNHETATSHVCKQICYFQLAISEVILTFTFI